MKGIALVLGLLTLIPAASVAQIVPPIEGYEIEVRFSDRLQARMATINRQEQRFEERFRENRHYARSPRTAGSQRFAKTATAGTQWAGERLIGEVSDFTLENLIKALVAYNVNRSVPNFSGHIEIELDRLMLTNASLAWLAGAQTFAQGRIKVTNAAGQVLFDNKVRTNLVIDTTVDYSHTGPELAFAETEASRRVGPVLAYFVEHALKRAWPEHRRDIVGPQIVLVSGPNTRTVIN